MRAEPGRDWKEEKRLFFVKRSEIRTVGEATEILRHLEPRERNSNTVCSMFHLHSVNTSAQTDGRTDKLCRVWLHSC